MNPNNRGGEKGCNSFYFSVVHHVHKKSPQKPSIMLWKCHDCHLTWTGWTTCVHELSIVPLEWNIRFFLCHNYVLFLITRLLSNGCQRKSVWGVFPIMTLSLLIIVWLKNWLKPPPSPPRPPLTPTAFLWGVVHGHTKDTYIGGKCQQMLCISVYGENIWTCKGN